jgi:hypothetical protein
MFDPFEPAPGRIKDNPSVSGMAGNLPGSVGVLVFGSTPVAKQEGAVSAAMGYSTTVALTLGVGKPSPFPSLFGPVPPIPRTFTQQAITTASKAKLKFDLFVLGGAAVSCTQISPK